MRTTSGGAAWHPFTTDGVQCVVLDAPCFATTIHVLDRADALRRLVDDECNHRARFTSQIDLAYYGCDPRVIDDDGVVIGTDGYPDAVGSWNDDLGEITWTVA